MTSGQTFEATRASYESALVASGSDVFEFKGKEATVNDYDALDTTDVEDVTDLSIIATRDKDMWTCFGWHYRWACGDRQPEVLKHWVPEFESKLFFSQRVS